MCWSCNAYCGNCKPPKEKPRQCTSCKAFNFDPEKNTCRKCGAELPARVPPPVIKCELCGMMCANPCKKGERPPADGILRPCKLRTPPPEELETNPKQEEKTHVL
ncbi:MAG: hypothetical protein GX248_10080 [Peptococcaceae bacterium]|jgi:hypothetical protein|nr:hypothetical protein [Peptococcaceae bacterium]